LKLCDVSGVAPAAVNVLDVPATVADLLDVFAARYRSMLLLLLDVSADGYAAVDDAVR
jgi:hypothetical protein